MGGQTYELSWPSRILQRCQSQAIFNQSPEWRSSIFSVTRMPIKRGDLTRSQAPFVRKVARDCCTTLRYLSPGWTQYSVEIDGRYRVVRSYMEHDGILFQGQRHKEDVAFSSSDTNRSNIIQEVWGMRFVALLCAMDHHTDQRVKQSSVWPKGLWREAKRDSVTFIFSWISNISIFWGVFKQQTPEYIVFVFIAHKQCVSRSRLVMCRRSKSDDAYHSG